MIQLFLKGWNIDNSLQSLLLGTTAISLFFLYKTLKNSQQQASNSQQLTEKSLSIDQYQIYSTELNYLVKMFQELRFQVDDQKLPGIPLQENLATSNGISYIRVFNVVMRGTYYFRQEGQTLIPAQVHEFRHQILFPLYRLYSILHNFLTRVQDDALLKPEHKGIIYLIVERDLLQHYFRICNNVDYNQSPSYDLSIFDTRAFNSQSLYAINEFYIRHRLFSLHDLTFYQQTL